MILDENLLTAFILLGIFVLGYLRMTGKTFPELIQEIKSIFVSEEVDLDLKW